MDQVQGRITIAPNVLTTIVRLTTLEQRGVHRFAPPPALRASRSQSRGLRAALLRLNSPEEWGSGRGMAEEGLSVEVTDQGAEVEVHIVADADASMLKLAEALQVDITRAIEEMVGIQVARVDVYIEDVVLPSAKAE